MSDSTASSISNSINDATKNMITAANKNMNTAAKSVKTATKSKSMKPIIIGILIFLIIVIILVALYFLIKALTSSSTPAAPASSGNPSNNNASNNNAPNNSGNTTTCPDNSQVVGVIPVEGGTLPGSYFLNVKNTNDCQDLCNSNAYCQWSTYIPSTGECFLNQGKNKSNAVSGFRIQDNPSGISCPSYTTFDNTVISNGQGTNYTANSVPDCENLCTTNSCMFFSLDGSQCNINNGVNSSTYVTSFPVGMGKSYRRPNT